MKAILGTGATLLGCVLVLAQSAWAQPAVAPPSPASRGALFRALPPLLQQGLSPGMTRQAFVDRIGTMFRYLDADRDGRLSMADALAYDRARFAAVRAKVLAAVVAFDTDADGRVSEDELVAGVRRGLPLPPGQSAMDTPEATAKGVLWAFDTNNDGFIDYDEMRAAPLPAMPANPVEAMLALAAKGAESLSEAEATETAATVVFDLLDADGDGTVDDAEYAAAAVMPRRP